jgi:holliday junction DNA helicase RuvA
MYEYIKGEFISCYDDIIVIEANGIGYCIFVPYKALDKLEKIGSEIKLFLSYVIKEDSQRFFGFRTEEERKLFEAFHAISGVGPKSALSIITSIEIQEIYTILASRDEKRLCTIPGIGKKTASRILLEMADKLEDVKIPKSRGPNIVEDAILALIELGITRSDAYLAVKKVEAPTLKLPDLIKKALATFSKKKTLTYK